MNALEKYAAKRLLVEKIAARFGGPSKALSAQWSGGKVPSKYGLGIGLGAGLLAGGGVYLASKKGKLGKTMKLNPKLHEIKKAIALYSKETGKSSGSMSKADIRKYVIKVRGKK